MRSAERENEHLGSTRLNTIDLLSVVFLIFQHSTSREQTRQRSDENRPNMHDYSDVDIVPLHEQAIKPPKESKATLSIRREDKQKTYSLIVKDGKHLFAAESEDRRRDVLLV